MRSTCIKCGFTLNGKNAQDMGICLECYNIEQSADFEEDDDEPVNIITTTLKKSISYEQSKSSLFNLNNHGREDLEIMLVVINGEREAIENSIQSNQYYLDNAEDMAEGLRSTITQNIEGDRVRLQSLLAWRALFWSAWDNQK